MGVSQVIPTAVGVKGGAQGISPLSVSASFSSSFSVTCSSPNDTPDIVLRHFRSRSDLPWMGRFFKLGNGFDNSVLCNNVEVERIKDSIGMYTVNCTFASPTDEGGEQNTKPNQDGKESKNPYEWHDEIEITFLNTTRPAEAGIFRGFITTAGGFSAGNARFFQLDSLRSITNSAGVPYDPSLEKDTAIRILRITKNFNQSFATNADGFLNTVNNDFFTINKPAYGFRYAVAPYCAKIKQYGSVFAIENSIPFWRETVEVHIRLDGWRRIIPDVGFHRRIAYGDLDDTGTKIRGEAFAPTWVPYTPITAKDGSPITVPVPLNGDGQQLIAGRPHVYIVYSVEQEIPFSGFVW